MKPDPDVVVIGGGPAGCAAAITLAKKGFQVSLFESKRFPRDLLCGEFLSPECAGTLLSLHPRLKLKDLGAVSIRQVRITAGNRATWSAVLPGEAYGLSRAKLDGELMEMARTVGVQAHEGCRVVAVGGSLDAGFQVTFQQDGSFRQTTALAVISGHGKRSSLDAALGRAFISQSQPYMALKAHYHGPALPGTIELHAFPGGYCGLSEVEEDLRNVCLLVSQPVFRQKSQGTSSPTENFIAWMQSQNQNLGNWLSQAKQAQKWISIAQVPFCTKPVMEKDVIMAGDAAGLIVPLAGDGISMALESGQLAGESIAHSLLGEWTAKDLRRHYPAQWQKRFGKRLRLSGALQPLLLRPQAAGLFLQFLTGFPALGQALIHHTRGRSSGSFD